MASSRLRIIIVGAGFGGVAAAVRLLEDGHDDLLIVDRADGVGGVWRANTYPGAQCDVPSHLYSFSFRPKADWSRRFAEQPEILDYLEEVVRAYGLARYLQLRTEVTSCEWDDGAQVWRVRLRGPDGVEEEREAHVVIAACGQLSVPAVPDLPGVAEFAGAAFHSAQWRHDVDLPGRRVAVIGTGASAVQFVPYLAREAAHVTVFQRSAPYIIGRPDRRYSALAKRLYGLRPVLAASRLRQYLWHEALGIPFTKAPWLMAVPERFWRLRMHRDITSGPLRAALEPGYRMGCKRLLRAPDWYRTLSRDDVSVVADQIRDVVPGGVRTVDGALHRADVLVFGTGFEATSFLTPMRVTGRGGRELSDEWRDGARAFLGIAVSGFPNLFLLYGPGTNLGHSSIIFMIESQLAWIRQAVAALVERDLAAVEVRPDAADRFDGQFRAASAGTVWESGCSSWYLAGGRNINNWPGSTLEYRRRTRRLDPRDVVVTPRRRAVQGSGTERVTA
jgi:cation diffusion facilitator CzcD-associated flavoprotein CzcO